MTTTNYSPKVLQQRKFFLWLPVLVAPFLFGFFYAGGGGKEASPDEGKTVAGMGFNMELPKPVFSRLESTMDKMAYYKKADEDSLRKKAYMQQDPYRRVKVIIGGGGVLGLHGPASPSGDRAEELMKKLEGWKKSMEQTHAPVAEPRQTPTAAEVLRPEPQRRPVPPSRPVDTVQRDPQLERLNQMLDKIIQIQHPGRDSVAASAQPAVDLPKVSPVGDSGRVVSNTFPAVVEGKQKMVSGATIALRLTDSALINGVRIGRDQLLYGVVSFHNDRMGVHIGSIRNNLSIYAVSLEVYDLDGLAGIHVPHLSGRQIARESADQGVGAMNLAAYDPSFGGQVANAGIQVARSLFHRKVRQEKVKVKDDYPVLLMNMRH